MLLRPSLLCADSTRVVSAGDATNDLVTAYEEKLNKVAYVSALLVSRQQPANLTWTRPVTVLIQLGLMTAAGLVALIAFSILRPNNSVIYQPKSKYSEDDKRPPKVEKGFFAR